MKIKLKVGLLSAVLSLLFSIPSAKSFGSLTSFTKPYQGVYSCKELRCGERDMTEYLKDFSLELLPDGKASFFFKDTEGNRRTTNGEYRYDEEKKTLTLSLKQGGKEYAKDFFLENGRITITFLVGSKPFYAVFEQN